MSSLDKKLKERLYTIVPAIIYLISVAIIAPVGNFLVNDDWIFVRQIEAFQQNIWALSSLIDPSFILQGLLGYSWAKFFGLNFDSLRLLSIALHAVSGIVFYTISRKLDISEKISFVVSLVFLFNPILYTSSMSFMTETYYIFFYLLAVMFFVLYAQELKHRHLFLGLLYACCAFLIREFAITLFIGYAFLGWAAFRQLRILPVAKRWTLVHVSVLLITAVVYIFWPKATQTTSTSFFTDKIWMIIFAPVYFAAFSFPLLNPITLKKQAFVIQLVLVLAMILFKFDIFPIGNVLYVEGLYAKSNFRSNLSIFDNVFFKAVCALFLGYFSVVVVRILKSPKVDFEGGVSLKLLSLLMLSSLLLVFFAPDFYERYLISAWIPFILLAAVYVQGNTTLTRITPYLLIAYCLFSFSLQYEFVMQSKIKMLHAAQLKTTFGVEESISLSGNYTKYVAAKELNDFVGNKNLPQISYSCYIQQYTLDTDSITLSAFNYLENFAEEFVANPKIYSSTKNDKIPRIKKNLDKLLFKTAYFSPMYSPIGKEAYVGSWCN